MITGKNPQTELIKKIDRDTKKYIKAKNKLKNKFQTEKFGDISILETSTKLLSPITKTLTVQPTPEAIIPSQDEGKPILQLLWKQMNALEDDIKSIKSKDKAINDAKAELEQEKDDESINIPPDIPENQRPEDAPPSYKDITVYNSPDYDIMNVIKNNKKQQHTKTVLKFNDSTGLFDLDNKKHFIIEGNVLYNVDSNTRQKILNRQWEINPEVMNLLSNDGDFRELNVSIEDFRTFWNFMEENGIEFKGKGKRIKSVKHLLDSFNKPSTSGQGITYLPSDPKLLVQRLQVLIGSKKAGNNNTRNEAISIMDNLLSNKHISQDEYDKLYHLINDN
jgi:hypothetical protein